MSIAGHKVGGVPQKVIKEAFGTGEIQIDTPPLKAALGGQFCVGQLLSLFYSLNLLIGQLFRRGYLFGSPRYQGQRLVPAEAREASSTN